jgi:hypothetical protein
MSAQGKKRKRPVSITVFFPQDPALRKQIVEDAKKFGVSASVLVKLSLDAGYPLVREKFKELIPLKK